MARRFNPLRSAPRSRYDAVIVGAGVGGLMCANWLARKGLSVLLVEQHFMVGGYCSTFRRGGFTFDAATHFYPLLGNPNTLTGRQLTELGIGTRWIKMDPVDRFHFPDGTDFSVPADLESYMARLRTEFPDEAAALDRFFALVRRAYLVGLLYHFRGSSTDELSQYLHLSVQQVLDRHFRSAKLKLLLTADTGHWGATPERTSFVFDSMLRLAYFLGNYYPEGGSQVFADDLAACFEAAGGHILMSSLVRRIHVSAGTARGIDIETGNGKSRQQLHVDADVVVSNADLGLTLEGMVGAEHFDPEYLASIRQLRPTLPCSVTHIGVQGISTDVLEEAQGYHWSSWNANDVATAAFKLFVPTLFDPSIAPTGGHVLIVQKLTAVDFPRVTDWTAEKAAIEAYVTAGLQRILPGFERHVVVSSNASALTSYRYTLNRDGAMLGWELAPDQTQDTRPGNSSPIRNLYFVGHWTRPGGGITPVMISAQRVAEAIVSGNKPSEAPPSAWNLANSVSPEVSA